MFGSIPIFGNSENKIDSKGRIFLPKFTDAEENDQLVIQRGNGNFYVIVNCSKVESEIKLLKKDSKEDKIALLTSSIVALVKVDKQRRIHFNPDEKFAIDRKVCIHGNYDSVQIFSSKEDYNEYITTLKKSR